MLYEVLAVLASLLVWVLTYYKWTFKYWEKRGVPYMEPRIPFGNSQNPFAQKHPNYVTLKKQHEYFKSKGHKHGGVYIITRHAYIPVDIELVKTILSKDFAYFVDRGVYFDAKNDPLSAHLFSLEGQQWRNLRTKLTPTFSSGKMRTMFQTLLDCGDQLKDHIDNLNRAKEPLDIKDILSSFTTDVIGSCAFGIDCNSFKDPDSEFRSHGRKIFTANALRTLRFFVILTMPALAKKLGIPIFERSLTSFFQNVVETMVRHREENNVKKNDFLQILLELKNGPVGLTMDQLGAQAFVFFLAGFETSSTTMNFCLFELAQNPDVQEKLREEILAALDKNDGGKLSYDGVMELKYMGQVIDETLRKYPPAPTLLRKCVEDYKIPGTDVILERGTRVFISVMGIHSDPEFYPDPEKFDPNRFSEESKAKRHHYAFLPFGEGPRACIGLRFGLMQTRVGLALILRNYRVRLSSKTELPLKLKPTSFLFATENRIWLETEKIE